MKLIYKIEMKHIILFLSILIVSFFAVFLTFSKPTKVTALLVSNPTNMLEMTIPSEAYVVVMFSTGETAYISGGGTFHPNEFGEYVDDNGPK